MTLRLGFTRGTAPSKWAERWKQATGAELELVPLQVTHGLPQRAAESDPLDVVLERTQPGEAPEGTSGPRTRHAICLYAEAVALVVPADHELAEQDRVTLEDLALIRLLEHPRHPASWPAPEEWEDPSWAPRTVAAALDLVAAGTGGILLPRPLARHLSRKREHAVIPLDAELPGTEIWVSWALDRDAADVQQLIGIMRGRTARSSRGGQDPEPKPTATREASPQARPKKKAGPKPGSRGAQLAAAREKAERAKAARRAQKKRR